MVPLARQFGAALVVGCIDEDAQQAQARNQQALDAFKKAAGACLEGRGYTVK